MDRFDAMKAFVAVATEGSFTQAAIRLDTSNQLVSKYVAQLEQYLGTRLFNRTTRRIHLTEAGEHCLQHAKQILENLEDMEGSIGVLRHQAQGLLRISAPVSFSTLHLSPLIRDFRRRFPEVGVDLQLNDRKVDVVEDGFDVALRIGQLKSSSLIARKIAPIRMVVCASPSYLAKYGEPEKPEDLIQGHFLTYSYMDYGRTDSPLYSTLKKRSQEKVSQFSANNGEVLVEAAIAGEGYILQPTFIAGEALKKKQLKVILSDYEPDSLALYAVYPHRKLIATKLRAFIDYLGSYYGEIPYWDQFE